MRGTQEGEDTCIHINRCTVVYQKLTQHHKAIILQYKKRYRLLGLKYINTRYVIYYMMTIVNTAV